MNDLYVDGKGIEKEVRSYTLDHTPLPDLPRLVSGLYR